MSSEDGPRSYPIPGKILEPVRVAGLTFDQLIILGFIPIITIAFSFFLPIPRLVGVFFGLLAAGIAVAITAKSPPGQSPITWAAAAFQRSVRERTGQTEYRIYKTERGRENATILDTVHTADHPGELSEGNLEFDEEEGYTVELDR